MCRDPNIKHRTHTRSDWVCFTIQVIVALAICAAAWAWALGVI